MKLIIPYPPSVNTYWRAVKGRVIISKRGREYRDAVHIAIRELDIDNLPLLNRLRVVINATMPDKRRRDLDNINKAAPDGLGYAGIFGDDEQIDDLRVIRGDVLYPGCLEVEITEID